VALTRAKYGIVLLGNPLVLSQQPLWNNLLCHFREHHCLVEGPLNNLKLYMVKFRKPRKYQNRNIPVGDLRRELANVPLLEHHVQNATLLESAVDKVQYERAMQEQGYGRQFRDKNAAGYELSVTVFDAVFLSIREVLTTGLL